MEPKIGVAIFVISGDGLLLLGKRKGSHGAGTWGLPGGHLEFKESAEICASRELREETDIVIPHTFFSRHGWSEAYFPDVNKHYITLMYGAETGVLASCVPTKEPDKCEKWEWFSPYHLPSPLFPPLAEYLRRYRRVPLIRPEVGLESWNP